MCKPYGLSPAKNANEKTYMEVSMKKILANLIGVIFGVIIFFAVAFIGFFLRIKFDEETYQWVFTFLGCMAAAGAYGFLSTTLKKKWGCIIDKNEKE